MNRKGAVLAVTAIVVVVAALIVFFLYRRGPTASAAPSPTVSAMALLPSVARVGGRAPEFQALTTSGLFDLDRTRKPVFLEIFATWCPHCQREAAVLDRLYAHYRHRVAFVAVSGSQTGMDGRSPSSDADVLQFRRLLHVRYPIAYDGSLSVAHAYLQGGFPTMVVINANKIVSYMTSGETSYAVLSAAIDKALVAGR